MGRRYRTYKKRNEDPLGALAFLILLVFGAYLWKAKEQNPAVLMYAGIVAALAMGVVIWLAVWKYQSAQRRLKALDISQIDDMDPLEFEKYVGKLLVHQGFYNVRTTERYDYGVDIIAEKEGVKWGVQVKRYGKLVKAEAVRQVYTALTRYKCDRAMVVTNSTYSRPARELAADNNCVLIDREILLDWIVKFQASKVQSP